MSIIFRFKISLSDFRQQLEVKKMLDLRASNLLAETILVANPWLRTFFIGDPIDESTYQSNSYRKLICARMIAVAEVLAIVSKSMDYNISVNERYYTQLQLERFSSQRMAHINNLCADSTFDALDPVIRFAILTSLAVVNEEHLDLTMDEILSRGFTQLCYQDGMILDFDPLLVFRIYEYLPGHLDLLLESIKSIIARDVPSENALLESFIEDYPRASISIVQRMIRSYEFMAYANVLCVLVTKIAAHHSVPHPLDLVDELHIRNLNQLVREHASLWKCFSPCTPRHFVRIITAIGLKRTQYLALEPSTLRYLFMGLNVASEVELKHFESCARAHGLSLNILSTSK